MTILAMYWGVVTVYSNCVLECSYCVFQLCALGVVTVYHSCVFRGVVTVYSSYVLGCSDCVF